MVQRVIQASDTIRIYYDPLDDVKDPYLISPSSDHGYPIPELSTLILFSMGVIALLGYVLLKKRDK
jgi:hypothetical protein